MTLAFPESGRPAPASSRGFPELSVLIPAYNEEACIESVVREAVCVLHGMGRPFELVVVDDGSSDGTAARLQRLRAVKAAGRFQLAQQIGRALNGAARHLGEKRHIQRIAPEMGLRGNAAAPYLNEIRNDFKGEKADADRHH